MIKKINIGFLGNQIAPGGGSASLLLMIKSLDKEKYNVFVLASECANEVVKKEFEIHCQLVIVNKKIKQFVSCAGHPPSFFEYVIATFSKKSQANIVINFIKTNNIDILHINNAVFSHLYPLIKKHSTVKIVSHLREQVHLYGKLYLEGKIINKIEKFSDKIIAISDKEAAPFNLKNKIVIVANPMDFSAIENIPKSSFRIDNKISEKTILIGMMGRFAKDKGHLLFLQAAKAFYEKLGDKTNTKFVILGINPPKKRWKLFIKKILLKEEFRTIVLDYIKNNQLGDKIILNPFIKDIYPVIKELDIYVRPSLSGDPWGRDIIEAMALGKIVIATGDYEFFIKDGYSGFLVKKISSEALTETIISVFKNTDERNVIEQRAKETVFYMTNILDYGIKLDNLYQNIL